MKYITSLLALSMSLLFVGCGGSSEFEGNNVTNTGMQSKFVLEDNLRQEATAFLQGETIEFVLSMTNNSNEDIVLEFNSGQRYDLYLKDNTNSEIWRWSSNRLFTQDLAEVTIRVGETLEYTDNWDQTLLNGNRPSTGNYSMHGFILGQPELFVNFTIQ